MTPHKNIILVGMKSSGKTTTGKALARKLRIRFTDMDTQIERHHLKQKQEKLRFRDIFKQYGKDYFRKLETDALSALAAAEPKGIYVLATGGGLPLAKENRLLLKPLGTIVFLDVSPEVLLSRIVAGGIPAFFPYPNDPERSLAEILAVRRPIYARLANISMSCGSEPSELIADKIINQLRK